MVIECVECVDGAVILRAVKLLNVLSRKTSWNKEEQGYVPCFEKSTKEREAIQRLINVVDGNFPGQMEELHTAGMLAWGPLIKFLSVNQEKLGNIRLEINPVIEELFSHHAREDAKMIRVVVDFFQNFEESGITDEDIDNCSGRN
jgi:hypothetical protein